MWSQCVAKERMNRCCGHVYSTNTRSHTQIQASILKYLNTLQICVSKRYLSVNAVYREVQQFCLRNFYNIQGPAGLTAGSTARL